MMMKSNRRSRLTGALYGLLIVPALLILPVPVNHAAEESAKTADQTAGEMQQEYVSQRYFVGDLMADTFPSCGFSADDLPKLEAVINLIQTIGPPEIWNKENSIDSYVNSGSLFIRQTELVHEQIKELLANTRKDNNIPESPRMKPGDVLEIDIEAITDAYRLPGPMDQTSPESDLPRVTAFTSPVRSDGAIALPKLLHQLNVEGMTLMETQSMLRVVYVEVMKILSQEANITISLIAPRKEFIPEPVLALLEKPFPCDFGRDVSLQTVLDDIHRKTGIPFVIDGESIQPQEMSVKALLRLHLPLRDLLDYLVRQHDLTWHYQNGTMMISRPDTKPVDRAYSIVGLVRPAGINPTGNMPDRGDMETIIDYIRTTIAPETWNEEVTIQPCYDEPILFIRQTETIHAQIADLLINLWKACPVLKVYDVKDIIITDEDIKSLITRIKETVTPDSWEKSVSIRAVEKSLYITHHATGHERINDLLRQLRFDNPAE